MKEIRSTRLGSFVLPVTRDMLVSEGTECARLHVSTSLLVLRQHRGLI